MSETPHNTPQRSWRRTRTGLVAGLLLAGLAFWLYPDGGSPGVGAEEEQTDGTVTVFAMGNTQAYLEVCGCADSLKGGYVRVASYLQAGAGNEPWTLVDAGNFLADDDDLAVVRARYALQLLQMLKPTALNLAPGDFVFGADFLTEHGAALPYVGAGIGEAGLGAAKLAVPALRATTVDGLPIAFVGIGANASGEELSEDAAVAIGASNIERARSEGARTVVLLAATSIDLARQVAVKGGGVEAILMASGGRSETPQEGEGGPLITPGEKVQFLAQLAFDRATGQLSSLTWIPMDITQDGTPAKELKQRADDYLAETEKLASANAAERATLTNEGLTNRYVGSKSCELCHEDEYRIWVSPDFSQKVHHFKAFQIFDPEFADPPESVLRATPACVACHVVGFRKLDPPKLGDPPKYVWYEGGVGCEVCHGPGEKHNATSDPGDIIRPSVLTARETLCSRCHVPDHSPDFDYLKYLKRIRHWKAKIEAPLRDGTITVPPGPPDPTSETFGHGKMGGGHGEMGGGHGTDGHGEDGHGEEHK